MNETQREIEASLGVGKAKHHRLKWVGWIGAVVLVGALGVWWMQGAEERAQVTYLTKPVSRGDLTVRVSATGTIEPTNKVEISSELSGTIAEVLVDYNDTVKAGQVLARLDTVQLDAQLSVQIASHAVAEAQLASARASLLEAEADFEIVRQLDQRGVTSHTNFTASEAALGRARATLASAQANVDLAEAQLDSQQAILSVENDDLFRASRAHVNTLIAGAGETITARARWLVRNNGYAANAVEAFASNVVGDGIKPSSSISDTALKEELQALWLAWTDEADAEGVTDFYGLQRRAAREVFIAGEVFFRIRPRRAEDGLTEPLQLQMLPAEMLPLDMTRELPGGGLIRQGIEFDRIGRPVAYHFLRRHPGDITDRGLVGETVRVPASDIIHVLEPIEAGQLRGVSRFAPAIVKLFTLDLYDDAELERKKTAAMFAIFITSPAPETPLDPADEDLEVEPGQVVRLDPGEDVSTPATPDSGSTYEPFQYRTLLQISAALGVPYGYLTGDTAKGNFSNTRIPLVDFRRRISAVQHSVMVWQMCRAVWARWMDVAVLSGALDIPGYEAQRRRYQACAWLPTKWDWVDPMKDANAEILQIEAGLKSRTQALSERGYDAEQVDREIAAERQREQKLGLDFRRPGSPAQGPGTRDGEDREDENVEDKTSEPGGKG